MDKDINIIIVVRHKLKSALPLTHTNTYFALGLSSTLKITLTLSDSEAARRTVRAGEKVSRRWHVMGEMVRKPTLLKLMSHRSSQQGTACAKT